MAYCWIMKVFSLVLTSLLVSLATFSFATELATQETPTAVKVETNYDREKDKTTVRLLPVQISGEKDKYHSIHIAPSFSHPGRQVVKPEIIDFEVRTVVKTKLKVDLYVVFVVDGETIFLSSNRSAVRNPVRGKRWIGERLVFRMPYETFLKITRAKVVEIKMDGLRVPIEDAALEQVRDFGRHFETQ
jgi:hypothetical protein